jgi:hypothetical protein
MNLAFQSIYVGILTQHSSLVPGVLYLPPATNHTGLVGLVEKPAGFGWFNSVL